MPFKSYKILAIVNKPYHGFVTEEDIYNPKDYYTFTVMVRTWWGFKHHVTHYTVTCTKGYKIHDWWKAKFKEKWITKLPFNPE
jgi:hypothetical protein